MRFIINADGSGRDSVRTIALLTLTVAFSFSSAYAKVNKCKVDGQIKYQDTPCPNNSGGEIELKPNVTSTKGLRLYMEQDRVPKMHRDQADKDNVRKRRRWMNGQLDTNAINRRNYNRMIEKKRKLLQKKDSN